MLLAREASTAVIFRRGPSRWTRLYLWNTRTDEITPGSWFAGRLYELMSDLSPDGRHLTYVARNESKRRQEAARTSFGVDQLSAWTALCRPPWIKALGLWNASDGWSGGAIFSDNRTLELQHSKESSKPLVELSAFTVKFIQRSERKSIMLSTLQRCGWQILPSLLIKDDTRAVYLLILRKKQVQLTLSRNSKYALIKTFSLTGTDLSADLDSATWADLDQRGRLVYARGGCLYALHRDVRLNWQIST